jgi:hypothetical protein
MSQSQKSQNPTNQWFRTTTPLPDGWYWWRCEAFMHMPYEEYIENIELLQIYDGEVRDERDMQIYEHQDFSGEWYGPVPYPPR